MAGLENSQLQPASSTPGAYSSDLAFRQSQDFAIVYPETHDPH
jgi:hypothetical protein